MKEDKPAEIIIPLGVCPRCNKEHEQVIFKMFLKPGKRWNLWGTCPVTKEPILLNIVTEQADNENLCRV